MQDGRFARLFDDGDADRIVAEVRASDVLARCHAEAQQLADHARAALAQVPASTARRALGDLADYVTRRNR
jgi:geranylgeranyl pyrophosphate synthase